MDPLVCVTPECGQVRRPGGRLCSACRSRRYLLRIDPGEYLRGAAGVCAIPGCSVTGDLQLDHDNFCCKNKNSGSGRCGGCNRGFVCKRHNLALVWIESIDHWEYLEDPASAPFVEYLLFWKHNVREVPPLQDPLEVRSAAGRHGRHDGVRKGSSPQWKPEDLLPFMGLPARGRFKAAHAALGMSSATYYRLAMALR